MRITSEYLRYVSVGLTVAVVLALTACGFHLRGQVQLAPQLSKIHIQGGDPYDPLIRELTRSLTSAGATVVPDAEAATAVLQVLANSGKRRVLSVASRGGKVQEYELYQTFEFRVRGAEGQELLAAQRLELTREYLFDAGDVLSKSTEEEALRSDLRRDLVRLAMLRLESLSR